MVRIKSGIENGIVWVSLSSGFHYHKIDLEQNDIEALIFQMETRLRELRGEDDEGSISQSNRQFDS